MQQLTKYVLTVLTMVSFATFCAAQATDSVQLSVFNTGVKYRLTPATFGAPTTGAELLTEMVLVQDTVISYVETGNNRASFMPPTLVAKMSDSLRRVFQSQRLMRPVITHRCDKPIMEDVKDKVVVMELGTCDPSVMCLNAQNAGAKAIVLIHPSNNTDSILLKRGPGRDELKIRCYSVTRGVGAKLSALLPSHVAIKKRVATPNQGLMAQTNNDSSMTAATMGKVAATTNQASEEANDLNQTANALTLNGIGWQIAPNPVSNEVTLNYNFKEPNTVNIDIFNEIGQLVTNYQLPNTQTGKLDINVTAWQNGTYNVRLTSGKFVEMKRMIVVH